MTTIGNVPEIIKVKQHLAQLKEKGLVSDWELPYENLLTRVSAAIFFLTPASEEKAGEIWEQLKTYPNFAYRENAEQKLSLLKYRVTFEDPNFK